MMSEAAVDLSLEMSQSVVRRISEILRTEPAGSFLRIGVDGGGCSGFTYTYKIDTERADDDLVLDHEGALVLIDQISLQFLRGCRIDFINNLMGRMFKIENPAATSSCGCGSGFAV